MVIPVPFLRVRGALGAGWRTGSYIQYTDRYVQSRIDAAYVSENTEVEYVPSGKLLHNYGKSPCY